MLDFLLSEEKLIEDTKPAYEEFTENLLKPKYRPLGNQQTYMLVIKNRDGQEVSHWSCEEIDVDDFKKSSENRGKVVEKFTSEEYWKKYRNGDFQMR